MLLDEVGLCAPLRWTEQIVLAAYNDAANVRSTNQEIRMRLTPRNRYRRRLRATGQGHCSVVPAGATVVDVAPGHARVADINPLASMEDPPEFWLGPFFGRERRISFNRTTALGDCSVEVVVVGPRREASSVE
jgi:hypothetical protein